MKRLLWIVIGLGLLVSLWCQGVFQPEQPQSATPVKKTVQQADVYVYQLLRVLSDDWGATQQAAPQSTPQGNGQEQKGNQ